MWLHWPKTTITSSCSTHCTSSKMKARSQRNAKKAPWVKVRVPSRDRRSHVQPSDLTAQVTHPTLSAFGWILSRLHSLMFFPNSGSLTVFIYWFFFFKRYFGALLRQSGRIYYLKQFFLVSSTLPAKNLEIWLHKNGWRDDPFIDHFSQLN